MNDLAKTVIDPTLKNESIENPEQAEAKPNEPVPAIRIRYRVRFGKTGLLRWISHRDLATLWERLVRRASLKLSMTEGFHPKPRIAFPSALALGVESLDEVVELELAEELAPADLLKRLIDDNQPGLTLCSVRKLPEGFGKAQLECNDYIVTAPTSDSLQVDWNAVQNAITELLAKESVSIKRKKKNQSFDIASNMQSIEIVTDSDSGSDSTQTLHMTIKNPQGAVLKPTDVLDLMGLENWIEAGATITRTRVHLQKEYDNNEPEHYACSGDVPTAKAQQINATS